MTSADDSAEITGVIARYSLAMDARQWRLMDDVFADNAEIILGEMRFFSRADGVAAIRACIECCSVTLHMNSNFVIDFDGDEADVRSNFRAWHEATGPTPHETLEVMGFYSDRFAKVDGRWRIARRVETGLSVVGSFGLFKGAMAEMERLGFAEQFAATMG